MTGAVGQPLPRVDGTAKVTGAARYAADTSVRGLTHAYLTMSTIARGRIVEIDTTDAAAAPGVIDVLTHLTMPRLNAYDDTVLALTSSMPLQDDLVHHAGQPVALVVADTFERARAAAQLVRVRYDEQPARVVLAEDIGAAYVPPAGAGGENEYSRGDAAGALDVAAVQIDASYTTPLQHANPLEPSATVARWSGGRLTVHDSTQAITNTRTGLAQALGVPVQNVRVVSAYIGGGFGPKGSLWPPTVLAAAAARKIGRPVKLVLTRADTYTSQGHRAETQQRIRLGASRSGRLTAIDHVITEQVSRTDSGVFNSSNPSRVLYACDNVRTTQRAVALDLPIGSFIRSPETAVSHVLESALDELSHRIGVDPVELRLRNWTNVNQESGQPYGSNHLPECYRRGSEMFGWSRRDPRPGSMRGPDDERVGWGMATAAHVTGGVPGSSASVTLTTEGSALIQCGTVDMGTGTYTVLKQVGADVLGLAFDAVTFELGDSRYPEAFLSAVSATVPSAGGAVARAAASARDEMVRIAVAQPGSPLAGLAPSEIGVANGELFATGDAGRRLTHRQVMRAHGRPLEVVSSPEDAPLGLSVGAVFVEVRINPRTGDVRVARMVGVFDAGRVLNRQTLRSQVLGGAIWNIGFALTEHTLVDARLGRIVTPNLSSYLVPVNADVPDIDVDFVDEPDPTFPALGARGFGETPSTGFSAAIGNAVYHAIGERVRELPITQDKILAALSR